MARWTSGDLADPTNWNDGLNWSTATVPTDVAEFTGAGSRTVSIPAGSFSIGELLYDAGAPSYTINAVGGLTITGVGAVNNSGNLQTLSGSTPITFANSSTAGNLDLEAAVIFNDSSTAGTAQVNRTSDGNITFNNSSSAGQATMNLGVGVLGFIPNSSFHQTSTAGSATLSIGGGSHQAFLQFFDSSTAANATITALSHAIVQFHNTSNAGNARLIASAADGELDFSDVTTGTVTAGSIEGGGIFYLGGETLTVGSNNLSTTVTGGVGGLAAGKLVKVGSGTLTLAGTIGYGGGSEVRSGTLKLQTTGAPGTGIITGGLLEIAVPDSQSVTYNGVGTLKLDAPASFTGPIGGLRGGDVIDLANTAVSSVSLSGSTLTVNETNGQTLSYQVSGQPAGSSFQVSSDGAGGSDLSVVGPMTADYFHATESVTGDTYHGVVYDNTAQYSVGQTLTFGPDQLGGHWTYSIDSISGADAAHQNQFYSGKVYDYYYSDVDRAQDFYPFYGTNGFLNGPPTDTTSFSGATSLGSDGDLVNINGTYYSFGYGGSTVVPELQVMKAAYFHATESVTGDTYNGVAYDNTGKYSVGSTLTAGPDQLGGHWSYTVDKVSAADATHQDTFYAGKVYDYYYYDVDRAKAFYPFYGTNGFLNGAPTDRSSFSTANGLGVDGDLVNINGNFYSFGYAGSTVVPEGIASPAPQGAPLAGGDGTTSANLALLGNMAAGSFTSGGGGAIVPHQDSLAPTGPLMAQPLA